MSNTKTALIIVDEQPDFMEGGALAVTGGRAVVKPTLHAAEDADLVVATRDWHPENHCSFTEQGGIWPAHCVAGTKGAEIEASIQTRADIIVSKAYRQEADAYSGFEDTEGHPALVRIEKHPDTHRIGEEALLADLLREEGIGKAQVVGLATDYCVKSTALGALKQGFEVEVLPEACAAVNLKEGDDEQALEEMRQAGAIIR